MVSRGLTQLLEIKRAERIHGLKFTDSFPVAQSIESIETQYGDFVADKELNGGCLDDSRSAHSKMTGRTGNSKSSRSGVTSSGQAQERTGAASMEESKKENEAEEDSDADSIVEEVKIRNAKIYLKAQLAATNEDFQRTLLERNSRPKDDMVSLNKSAVTELNRSVQAHMQATGARKISSKDADTSFMKPGEKIHIYSGQALNTAELQKKALRAKMAGQEGQKLWTYSEQHNSGCFPMLDKEVSLDRMLREEVKQDDGRETFRYPRPREAADCRKPANSVSEARKDELRYEWVENELHSELEKKEVVRGAFDAQSLGIGGAHVIPVRRPVLHLPPPDSDAHAEAPPKPEKFPPMRFQARASVGLECAADKYQKTLLDGKVHSLGIRFEERRPAKHIRNKFGIGRSGNENVKAPPATYQIDEQYLEDKANYDYLTDFMRSISRPLKTYGPAGPDVSDSVGGTGHVPASGPGITQKTLKPTNQAWRDATLAAREGGNFEKTGTCKIKAPLSARAPRPGARQAQPLSAR